MREKRFYLFLWKFKNSNMKAFLLIVGLIVLLFLIGRPGDSEFNELLGAVLLITGFGIAYLYNKMKN